MIYFEIEKTDTEQILGWTKDEKKLEDFLRELGGSITDDILQSMKYILHGIQKLLAF